MNKGHVAHVSGRIKDGLCLEIDEIDILTVFMCALCTVSSSATTRNKDLCMIMYTHRNIRI